MGNLVVQLNSLTFQELMRSFFGPIAKFLYFLIAKAYDLVFELANNQFGLHDQVMKFTYTLSNVFVIYMIFRITISILNYLINPDSFSDKTNGFSKLIIRIIIVLALLIGFNPLFDKLTEIESTILGYNDTSTSVIDNIILGNQKISYIEDENGNKTTVYTLHMQNCPDDYNIYSFSKGDMLSVLALKPFYDLKSPEEYKNYIEKITGDDDVAISEYEDELKSGANGYCGTNETAITTAYDGPNELIAQINLTPNNAYDLLSTGIYENQVGDWDLRYDESFVVEFNYIWAIISGVVVLLLLISYAFDVVIRTLTLFLYQVIAPIPIIAYVSPNKNESGMLVNWFKKIIGCWASLFMRLAILDLAFFFIDTILHDTTLIQMQGRSTIVELFVIIGILMFAKKLPKLIEGVIPGLKLDGGFQLNPLKRISKDALGGNALLGLGAGAAAAGLSGLTNGIQRTYEGFRDHRGLRRTLGTASRSAIAGATRGGVNAFNRTRKDGHVFAGAWNGYQTSMYSKLLREEYHRKGGTAGGAIAADLHRWTGTLTAGQQEQITAERQDQLIDQHESELRKRNDILRQRKESLSNDKQALADEKRSLAQEKHDKLEPLELYSGYGQKIKDRVSNDKAVKDATKALEDAQAHGDETKIKAARDALEAAEKATAVRLMRTDSEVQHYVRQMTQIRNEVQMKQGIRLENVYDSAGGFNSKSIYDTQHVANIIKDQYSQQERGFTDRERALERRQTDIDEYQRTQIDDYKRVNIDSFKESNEYKVAHQKDSPAKEANARQNNNKPQEPGKVFAAGRPTQWSVGQSSYNGPFGGGPGGPPPGGGNH